jgi:hypothetical protein
LSSEIDVQDTNGTDPWDTQPLHLEVAGASIADAASALTEASNFAIDLMGQSIARLRSQIETLKELDSAGAFKNQIASAESRLANLIRWHERLQLQRRPHS